MHGTLSTHHSMPIPSHPKNSDAFTKVSLHIHDDIMLFFEKMILGRGWVQNVFSELFIQFHAECVRRGIKPQYEPDAGETVALILSQLRFSLDDKDVAAYDKAKVAVTKDVAAGETATLKEYKLGRAATRKKKSNGKPSA